MNYTPRYTYWLYKANVKTNQLPEELAELIRQYESAVAVWQEAKENEQEPYKKVVENTDAFISAKLYTLYETQINQQNDSDKLKELMNKAAELDF
jgi:mevalonate kinase